MAEEAAEAEGEKKKNPLILFIAIAVVLVAASVGGTIMILGGGGEAEEEVVEEVTPDALYYSLVPKFNTNYEVDGRQRLFQVGVTLVTREQDVIDALAQHAPTIKSKLVILLSGQDFHKLQTPEGRAALRESCLEAVRGIMEKEIGKPGVEKVLFTDYVMQ